MPHPILNSSYSQLARLISQKMSQRTQEKVAVFLAVYGQQIEQLFECSAFAILTQQIQTGLKPFLGLSSLDIPIVPYLKIPRNFTRSFHCKMVAALGTVFACKLMLSTKDTLTLTIAGACHDLGHIKFGHTGERMLQKISKDYKDHETLTQEILVANREIQNVLADMQVSTADVVGVMKEKGRLGAMQRLVDTLGWTTHDSLISGFFGSPNLEQSIAYACSVLLSIDNVQVCGVFATRNRAPLQEMVNIRTLLFRDFYKSQTAEQAQCTLNAFMKYAFENGMIVPNDLYDASEHEQDLVRRMILLADKKEGFVGQWLSDLILQSTTLELPPKRWRTTSFANGDGLDAFNRIKPHLRKFSIYVPKQNGSSLNKSYEVRLCSGQRITISPDKAILKVAQERDLAFTLVPNFIPNP